jgi:hypothetical protein
MPFLEFSSLQIQLSSTGSDSIRGGRISLGTDVNLSVDNLQTYAPGTSFHIVTATDSVTGTFRDLPNLSMILSGPQLFQIQYSPTGVDLVVVPEPAEIAAVAGLGLIGFAAWRRRQRRSASAA